MPVSRSDKFSLVFQFQITRYPLMEISDFYKLAYQAAMGSGHAVKSPENAWKALCSEISSLEKGPLEPALDPISENILRINLRPFLEKKLDINNLFDAFIRTANEYRGNFIHLEKYLMQIMDIIIKGNLRPKEIEADDYFSNKKLQGYPPVHHSEKYRKLYKPAYRVIAEKFMVKDFL